jgi:hypothetical protein
MVSVSIEVQGKKEKSERKKYPVGETMKKTNLHFNILLRTFLY